MEDKSFGRVESIPKEHRHQSYWDMFATWVGANANNGTWYVGGVIAACDTPEALKRKYGRRDVRVLYRENGAEQERLFSMDDKDALSALIRATDVVKLHSQEATLEEIFLQVTGKELSA